MSLPSCFQSDPLYAPGRIFGTEEEVMELTLHTKVELKKQHPCGSRICTITRVGMDIKIRCDGCGHELMLPRSKFEKAVKRLVSEEGNG
jgi:hypothetical protein